MAQAIAVDPNRLWFLIWTRSTMDPADGRHRHWARILELAPLVLWPEVAISRLLQLGDWRPLDAPMPTDALLASARPQPTPDVTRFRPAAEWCVDPPKRQRL